MPSCEVCGKLVPDDADYCPGCGVPLRVRPAPGGPPSEVVAKGQGLGPAIAVLLAGFATAGLLVGLLIDASVGAMYFGYFIAGTLAGVGVALGVKVLLPALPVERVLLIVVTWGLAWSVSYLVIVNSFVSVILETALGAMGTALILRSFPDTAGVRWLPILLSWVLAGVVTNFLHLVTTVSVPALVFTNIVEGCGGIMTMREVVRARTAPRGH